MNYFDPKNPIDCAWRSRLPAFMRAPAYGYDAAGNYYGSSGDHDAHVEAWRARPSAIVKASDIEAEYVARPFRFEDLNGAPEPAKWGPTYPEGASASVSKWRMTSKGRELSSEEKAAYGQAVGEWIKGLNSVKRPPAIVLKYSMPNYAAKCRAEFAAAAGRDRREWADGKAKSNLCGSSGLTIEEAYAQAMAEKAARQAGQKVQEPTRLTVAENWGPAKPKAARRPRKRVLEAA